MAKKKINLALQGGGAHGAFTWGVLSRLVEENIEVEGITATSAGAMNAAVFKHGWLENGADGVKKRLEEFWMKVGGGAPNLPEPITKWLAAHSPGLSLSSALHEINPAYKMSEIMMRHFSPYEFNPFNVNPLKDIIDDIFHDETMACAEGPALFISATNVRSGKIKVFQGDEITPDAILASACLPQLFQAVEIYDKETKCTEAYWDGGFMGNPALFPLYATTETRDILIVHINPTYRNDVPMSATDIADRVNEISFNSSLIRELRAIEFVARLIDEGHISTDYKKLNYIHSIKDDETMAQLGAASKMTPDPNFLRKLCEKGVVACDKFIRKNWKHIGHQSSVDLKAMFTGNS